MTDWIKRLQDRGREAKSQCGKIKRVHMNDRVYDVYLPSDVWIPYTGSTDFGEMILNDERVEIMIDKTLRDNQVIFEF
jgi:hypothetical protein